MPSIVARRRAVSGHGSALRSILEAGIAPTRAEEGRQGYVRHQGVEDAGLSVLYENGRTRAAFDRQMETAHCKRVVAEAKPHLNGPLEVAVRRALD